MTQKVSAAQVEAQRRWQRQHIVKLCAPRQRAPRRSALRSVMDAGDIHLIKRNSAVIDNHHHVPDVTNILKKAAVYNHEIRFVSDAD